MIPAILSCVFVIYLYHKLNSVPKSSAPPAVPPNSEAESMASLINRLDSLRARLDALQAGNRKDGGK